MDEKFAEIHVEIFKILKESVGRSSSHMGMSFNFAHNSFWDLLPLYSIK